LKQQLLRRTLVRQIPVQHKFILVIVTLHLFLIMKIPVHLFIACLLLYPGFIFSQQQYPKNYFRNPLDIPIQLAANFGELRPDHFHMGLDIRTQGRENLPVYASADGYISRIKIEKWGYGKAIYITHPNGFVTLYAHLNSFYSPLEDFVKKHAYDEESWEQDINFEPGSFPVKKGQFIALSGNTGGSAGPHLHFEIRDKKTGNNFNPQLFGLGIADNIAPVIEKLFIYDRRYSTSESVVKQVALKASGNSYTTQPPIVKTGTPMLSFGVTAEDKSSNSTFKFGIYQAELWMDDSLINAFQLNDFSYDETRYVNACIDYSKYKRQNVYVQYLSILPGNRLKIFSEAGGPGKIALHDTLPHRIGINIKDVNGNAARLTMMLQFDGSLQQQPGFSAGAPRVFPNQPNTVKSKNAQFSFPETAFYDTALLVVQEEPAGTKNAASAAIVLPQNIPVHGYYTAQIKTSLSKGDPLRNHVIMFLTNGKSKDAVKGTWNGDFMYGNFKKFAVLQLMIDTVPPTIKPVGWKEGSNLKAQQSLKLHCTDQFDEVAFFSARLENGQWLLFAKKDDDFIYYFDQYCPPGPHTLTVTVTDKAGNKSEAELAFTR